jgi:hypothetical protein
MSDIDTLSTMSIASLDLSNRSTRHGYADTILQIVSVLRSVAPLSAERDALAREYMEDVLSADTDDVEATGEDALGDLESWLDEAGLHGYAEDEWYYVERLPR